MSTAQKLFQIEVRRYRDSDLLLATSDDLRGLNVVGRTDQEIELRVPGSVRELLEAQGHSVVDVAAERSDRSGFVLRNLVAKVTLAAA
jgi:hypothetical protein